MRVLKAILTIVIAILIFIISFAFIVHNQTPVSVDLLVVTLPEFYLSVWLIIFFVMGGLTGLAVSMLLILREKSARVRVEKRLRTTSKLITGQTS